MKQFKDFGKSQTFLDGDKIKIEEVLNTEIIILNYSIKSSNYKKNKSGDYLTLQIEIDSKRKILFTGSDVLIQQLKDYGKEIPFTATIKKINKFYTLT